MNYCYKRVARDVLAWQFTAENFISSKHPEFIRDLCADERLVLWSYDGNTKINGFVNSTKQFIYPSDWIVLENADGHEIISIYSDEKFKLLFENSVPKVDIRIIPRVVFGYYGVKLNTLIDESNTNPFSIASVIRENYECNREDPSKIIIKDIKTGKEQCIEDGDQVLTLSDKTILVVKLKGIVESYSNNINSKNLYNNTIFIVGGGAAEGGSTIKAGFGGNR